ncbi:MAG: MATE family efflux transporter [Chloroflexales bacterium]|nr:MATE family efflux transporter [Chloroflexales bacterium]
MSATSISAGAREHPFVRAPNATLIGLALPVLFALIAEPLTGLVDTAFVASLGTVPLAALGVGATALSGLFWAFNFLEIGSQTEVANRFGRGDKSGAARIAALAFALSLAIGVLLTAVISALVEPIAAALGAEGELHTAATAYIRIRAFGAPAVLLLIAALGVLRGLQEMRTSLWIALGINVLNIGLDAVLIFGAGPLPALGVSGAALASVIAQWLGAIWAVFVVVRHIGLARRIDLAEVRTLLRIGGDLFVRTGLLTLFMILTTRTATQIGAEAGAAHQVLRQLWVLSALFLDAFAVTGQSLVGYFAGAGWHSQARRVARYVCLWSLVTGVILAGAMLISQPAIEAGLVPLEARAVFGAAWLVAVALQPFNALTFATDGIHWGTGDFGFLRNAMIVATATSVTLIWLIDPAAPAALTLVWVVTGLWNVVRAVFGVARVWPGSERAPLGRAWGGAVE